MGMKQYCRYCTYFVTGNGNYCEKRRIEPSDEYAKRPNVCKDFDYNEIDAFDIGRTYKPREKKKSAIEPTNEQITIF